MSNVVTFESFQKKPATKAKTPKSMTLFIHIKHTTLIAHCANLKTPDAATVGRVGERHS
jgi:hypothetical protein